MRILIVGAGAVGGYFGTLWSHAGRDVTFLLREARQTELKASGLTVVRGAERLFIQPHSIIAAHIKRPYDVILLAVTGNALAEAIEQILPAVGPGSIILAALNGVRHFHILRATFGDDAVPGCVVKCVTARGAQGRIVELAPVANITIGHWSGVTDDRLEAIADLLAIGGVEVGISSIIQTDIAEKWLMMATLGAGNALLDGDVGTINATTRGGAVLQTLLDEGWRALTEIGMAPRPKAATVLSRMLEDRQSRQTSSLYRAMRAGQPVELEPILGDLLDRVEDDRAYPLLSAAYARLALYETRRRQTASERTETA